MSKLTKAEVDTKLQELAPRFQPYTPNDPLEALNQALATPGYLYEALQGAGLSNVPPALRRELAPLHKAFQDLDKAVANLKPKGKLDPMSIRGEGTDITNGPQPQQEKLKHGGKWFHEAHDYSSLLPEKHQDKKLIVHHTGYEKPSGQIYGENIQARLHEPRGGRIGQVVGKVDHDRPVRTAVEVLPQKHKYIEPHSTLDHKYRGQKLGQAMYEAVYAHAKNVVGIDRVGGGIHSEQAHKLHQALARKHGFEYDPSVNFVSSDEYNSNNNTNSEVDTDYPWGDYYYNIKSEDTESPEDNDDDEVHLFSAKHPPTFTRNLDKTQSTPTFPKLGLGDDRRETPIVEGNAWVSKRRAMAALSAKANPHLPEHQDKVRNDPQYLRFSGGATSGTPGIHTAFAAGPKVRERAQAKVTAENPSVQLDSNASLATQLHENWHQMMLRVQERYGNPVRSGVARYLVHGAIPQHLGEQVNQIGSIMHPKGAGDPEEQIAVLHNYLNSPGYRAEYHSRLGFDPFTAWGNTEARAVQKKLKEAHRAIHEAASNLTPEHVRSLAGYGLGKSEAEGLDKAIADLKPGKTISIPKSWPKFFQSGAFHDYSHILSPQQRSKGYEVKVHQPEPDMYTQNQPPVGAYVLHNGDRVGEVHGSVFRYENKKPLKVYTSEVNVDHRGQGLGQAAYEALMAHSYHKLGARQVSGDQHSTSAHGVHAAIARKHGLEYQPAPLPPEDTPVGDFDSRYGHYDYALKTEVNKTEGHLEPAFRNPESGEIVRCGTFHDLNNKPESWTDADPEPGFVDEAGHYFTREEAAVEVHQPPHPLQSEELKKADASEDEGRIMKEVSLVDKDGVHHRGFKWVKIEVEKPEESGKLDKTPEKVLLPALQTCKDCGYRWVDGDA